MFFLFEFFAIFIPMLSHWKVVHTGIDKGERHMQWDADALETLDEDAPCILHLYEWEAPTISYGYFLKPEVLFKEDAVRAHGLQLVRRPTGGGAVFHLWDMAFSVLLPHRLCKEKTLDNYQLIHRAVLDSVRELASETFEGELAQPTNVSPERNSFCMAQPTSYDLVWENKKIAGAAQRRTKNGLLHQGFIALSLPEKSLLEEILVDRTLIDVIGDHTYPLLKEGDSDKEIKEKLSKLLIKYLQQWI
jgi:lipoate---protein ligase